MIDFSVFIDDLWQGMTVQEAAESQCANWNDIDPRLSDKARQYLLVVSSIAAGKESIVEDYNNG